MRRTKKTGRRQRLPNGVLVHVRERCPDCKQKFRMGTGYQFDGAAPMREVPAVVCGCKKTYSLEDSGLPSAA